MAVEDTTKIKGTLLDVYNHFFQILAFWPMIQYMVSHLASITIQ